MKQKKLLLGYYNYTVILTYIGMLTGFLGIINAFEDNLFASIICLMIAGLCDMFDGTIASTMVRTREEKCFGIQIDSLSDLICFGALPATIVYSQNRRNLIISIICSLYLLSALIRLAYFNVDEQARQEHSDTSRKIYFGLPVTTSALLLPLVYSALHLLSWSSDIIPAIVLLVMGCMFLTPFRLEKPGRKGKLIILLLGVLVLLLVKKAIGSLR